MSASLVVVPDPRALARCAAEWIVERTRAAVASRGSCSLALAGGSTPRATYEVLGTSALAAALPWGAIDWFFGDERAVPFDHPDSNYRLAAESLFAGRPQALARACRMPAGAAAADLAARAYGQLLPEPLDVVDVLKAMTVDGKAKQITMEFVRDVTTDQIRDAYRDGFEANATDAEKKEIAPHVETFLSYFDAGVKENQQFVLRWLPGGKIAPIINNAEKPAIVNATFARVLWTIWFGEDSIVDREDLVKFMVPQEGPTLRAGAQSARTGHIPPVPGDFRRPAANIPPAPAAHTAPKKKGARTPMAVQRSDIDAIYRIPSPTLDPENSKLSAAAIERRLPMGSGLPLDDAVLSTLLSCGGLEAMIRSSGSGAMTLDHPSDMVWRKSSYVCGRTVGIGSDTAACNLPGEMIDLLREGYDLTVQMTVTVPTI